MTSLCTQEVFSGVADNESDFFEQGQRHKLWKIIEIKYAWPVFLNRDMYINFYPLTKFSSSIRGIQIKYVIP